MMEGPYEKIIIKLNEKKFEFAKMNVNKWYY